MASIRSVASTPRWFCGAACRLLLQYQHRGVPVKFHSAPWSEQQKDQALKRGPHQSCRNHLEFLSEEFCDMIRKEQWVVLPYQVANQLPNLRLSPPGVVLERDRRPRWIVDYSFSGVNQDTLPLAPSEAMQFGHTLDRLLREILLANPFGTGWLSTWKPSYWTFRTT